MNFEHHSDGHKNRPIKDAFVEKLSSLVESNMTNEQFGVEELAQLAGISRSQLHRKLQKSTGQSVSQFIREYRLQRAFEMIKSDVLVEIPD